MAPSSVASIGSEASFLVQLCCCIRRVRDHRVPSQAAFLKPRINSGFFRRRVARQGTRKFMTGNHRISYLTAVGCSAFMADNEFVETPSVTRLFGTLREGLFTLVHILISYYIWSIYSFRSLFEMRHPSPHLPSYAI